MFFASDDGDVRFAHKYREQNANDIRISVLDPSSFEVINESQAPECGWRITASSDEGCA
jgi:hypothetical protein